MRLPRSVRDADVAGKTVLVRADLNVPLDGGRVIQAFIWMRTGDRNRGARTAARAGRGIGATMIGLGLAAVLMTTATVDGLWFMLLGWFLLTSSTAEERSAAQHQLLDGVRAKRGELVAS